LIVHSRYQVSVSAGLVALTLLIASFITVVVSCKKHAYVPVDLDDCLMQLDSTLSPAMLDTMRNWTEEDVSKAHFELGLWIRNNWGLRTGSRLSKWFNERDIWHPDDMSGIILTSYWRHLHNRPIELDAQVKYYVDYWKYQTWPDTLKCSICGKRLKDRYMAGPGIDSSYPGEVTMVLYCPKKHPWFYSWSRGLYSIDEEKYHGLLDTLRLRLTH
jgi:hypothetical protein